MEDETRTVNADGVTFNPNPIRCAGALCYTALMPNPKKPRANCPACGKPVKRVVDKFCGNHCQGEYAYRAYIERWLAGLETGRKGNFYAVSDNVRRWMRETYGDKCSECGWSTRHLLTGKVPLTIDHIDGDVANC